MDHPDNISRSALLDLRSWLTPLLLLYLFLMYSLGLFALIQSPWWVIVLGVLAITHSLILMAYLLHDCAHHSVFQHSASNDYLGQLLNFILGTAYTPYADIRCKHMRHHIDKIDVIAFDYRRWMVAHPNTCRIIQRFEWLGVPATELLFHFRPLRVFWDYKATAKQRYQVALYGMSRGIFFGVLAWFSLTALLAYALAYLLMVLVLRLMDLPQHSYQTFIQDEPLDARPANRCGRERQYEQQHTFSNPLGASRLLNFMVLNFGYHNAHHQAPTQAWFRLNQLSYPTSPLNWRLIIRFWWRYRCQRVVKETTLLATGEKMDIGSYGLSFLTVA